MAAREAAQNLVTRTAAEEVAAHELTINGDVTKFPTKPGFLNSFSHYTSTNGPTNALETSADDHVKSLLNKTEALLPGDIEAIQALAKEIGMPCLKYMSREYFKIFNQAMDLDAATEMRLFCLKWCNILIQLDRHQRTTEKSDKEMWPLIFTSQSQREEEYEGIFGDLTE
jgi:hypothetical protein